MTTPKKIIALLSGLSLVGGIAFTYSQSEQLKGTYQVSPDAFNQSSPTSDTSFLVMSLTAEEAATNAASEESNAMAYSVEAASYKTAAESAYTNGNRDDLEMAYANVESAANSAETAASNSAAYAAQAREFYETAYTAWETAYSDANNAETAVDHAYDWYLAAQYSANAAEALWVYALAQAYEYQAYCSNNSCNTYYSGGDSSDTDEFIDAYEDYESCDARHEEDMDSSTCLETFTSSVTDYLGSARSVNELKEMDLDGAFTIMNGYLGRFSQSLGAMEADYNSKSTLANTFYTSYALSITDYQEADAAIAAFVTELESVKAYKDAAYLSANTAAFESYAASSYENKAKSYQVLPCTNLTIDPNHYEMASTDSSAAFSITTKITAGTSSETSWFNWGILAKNGKAAAFEYTPSNGNMWNANSNTQNSSNAQNSYQENKNLGDLGTNQWSNSSQSWPTDTSDPNEEPYDEPETITTYEEIESYEVQSKWFGPLVFETRGSGSFTSGSDSGSSIRISKTDASDTTASFSGGTKGDKIKVYTEYDGDVCQASFTITQDAVENEGTGTAESPEVDVAVNTDADGDGLSSTEEASLGTSDSFADTDGDGLNDFEEVKTHLTDPLKIDTDGDGNSDSVELTAGTDPLVADSTVVDLEDTAVTDSVVEDVVGSCADESSFTDVSDNEWYCLPVNALSMDDVIQGRSTNQYVPNDYVTYAEFTKMVDLAILGKTSTDATGLTVSLPNVDSRDWFYPYIALAQENGFLRDYDSDAYLFNPNAYISKKKAALYLARALEIKVSDFTAPFSDTPLTDPETYAIYALSIDFVTVDGESVAVITGNTDSSGNPDGTFSPNNYILRSEAAALIYRATLTLAQ